MRDLLVFLDAPVPAANVLAASYNSALVVLSYIVASVAAYTAVDFASRMRESRAGVSPVSGWLLGGAFAMGSGIWCMRGAVRDKNHVRWRTASAAHFHCLWLSH